MLFIGAPAHAATLRPDQAAALEAMLNSVEPQMRPMLRKQLEDSISVMTPEQVALFMSGFASQSRSSDAQDEPEPEPEPTATGEDLEYNRQQYEPVVRKHWAAKKAFDDFVTAELNSKCPKADQYAVFRSAERYELMPLSPNWHRAATSADLEAQVIGAAYVPQDGRYDFDFSKVRMTFDKQAVSAAITKACADWTKEAVVFKEKAAALMYAGKSNEAMALENAGNQKISAIDETLTRAIDALSPAANANAEMMNALMNPKKR